MAKEVKEPEEKEPKEEPKAPEAPEKEPKATPSPSEMVLDGEGIPDQFKGKTIRQVMDSFESLSAADKKKAERLQRLEEERVPAPAQPPAAAPPQMTQEQVQEQFYRDPVGTVNQLIGAHVAQRVAPIQAATQQGSINQQLREMEQEPDWAEHKEEVMRLLSNLPPHIQAQPDAFRAALTLSRGKKQGETLREKQLQTKMGTGGAPPTPASAKPASKAVEVDPDVRKVAEGLGLDPVEYQKMLDEEK